MLRPDMESLLHIVDAGEYGCWKPAEDWSLLEMAEAVTDGVLEMMMFGLLAR